MIRIDELIGRVIGVPGDVMFKKWRVMYSRSGE